MLISKHIAGPHENWMAAFFLIFFTWGQKKKGRKKHLWSPHGLNEERYGLSGKSRACALPPLQNPSCNMPVIPPNYCHMRGKNSIKTARKFIKGWLILFLLTGCVHIFHAWACVSSEREETAFFLRLFPAWPLFVNRQSLWHTNLASKGFTLHRPQGLEAFQAYKTHLSSTKASGY